jgi:von Willebrand factor A domain-containing protein 3
MTIHEAINWLNEWHYEDGSNTIDSATAAAAAAAEITFEACTRAFEDESLQAVYLLSEGASSSGAHELHYDKMVKMSNEKRMPLNVVSFNCEQSDIVEYLKRLAESSYGPGRFHAYCLLREVEDYEAAPVNNSQSVIENKVIVNRKGFGGAPPGAGVRNDLILVFNELLAAKESLANLKAFLNEINSKAKSKPTKKSLIIQLNGRSADQTQNKHKEYEKYERDDDELTTKEWLAKNGLQARKLELFDALSQVCFRHCDGIVDIKQAPARHGKLVYVSNGVEYFQSDSVSSVYIAFILTFYIR